MNPEHSDPVFVVCPYCWEPVAVEGLPEGGGEYVTDCEVCCRPILVRRVGGEIEARRENE